MATNREEVSFEPVQTHRTFEIVCNQIREKLADGQLKPGDKLPAERLLAKQLGVSRSAIREALRSLEIAGIVRLVKGTKGGAFIEKGSPAAMSQVVQDLVHLGAISMQDLTEVRITFLESIMPMACQRATEADFKAMESTVEDLEEAVRTDDYAKRTQATGDFYHWLATCTHNSAAIYMVDTLTTILRHYISNHRPMPAKDLLAARKRFLKALKARDAEKASEEMRKHLTKVHRLLWQP